MLIRVHHEGESYQIEVPEGSELTRHGHKPAVLGGSLDDVLRVPTPEGLVRLPTPLVIYCAREGRYGLRLVAEAADS